MSNRFCPKSVHPASRHGRFGVTGRTVATALVVALAAIAVSSQDAPQAAPQPEDAGQDAARDAAQEYRELTETLRRDHPDRDAVEAAHEGIVARLERFIERHGSAPEVGDARILAAEVLLLGGKRRAARDIWDDLTKDGPRDEDRARGLYLLGEYYFLLESSNPARLTSYQKAAFLYFSRLESRYPRSSLAAAAKRSLDYLRLLREEKAPVFEATFGRGEEKLEFRSAEHRGQVILLIFWKSSSAGHRRFLDDLATSLPQVLREYPAIREKVKVLGVSLDRDRRYFEAAVRDWKIPFPQIHDGRGFEGDLARRFHIPRAPHFAVIDHQGGLTYLGPTDKIFSARASGALRELRLSLEEKLEETTKPRR